MQKLLEMFDQYIEEKIRTEIELVNHWHEEAKLEDLRLTVVQLVESVQTLRSEHEETEILDTYDIESLISDNTMDDDDIERKIEEAIDSALENLTISVER